ncbi:hypothetical protein SAMN05421821_102506 [Mucilaginibacter lappiensis]|uniref:Tetratricopeptide repeat-containing protein n=1 Tax=Mucilaginibacter lappiensis TaxID=354630 RepID=A0ABR6PEQ5_9SPHI|nr:DUF6624 domain-containing protein [Mucilaginibacter lappiensis]MBB6108257.1 hypothetical protein [Mucilaginibacter lappiensis]SIQ45264.1 hypothetical protein SAMN05421821_102506 [Mucilaginibacter lappiensis]
MKFSFLVLLCSLFAASTIAQTLTVKQAYELTDNADSLAKAGNIKSAISNYLKSASQLPSPGFNFRDVAHQYLKIHDEKNARTYIDKAVQYGITIDQLNADTLVKAYLAQISYDKDYAKQRIIYNRQISYPDQRTEILQMLERDQLVRDLIGRVDIKVLNNTIIETDSANMDELRDIIKQIGFPGFRQIGPDAASGLFGLITHATTDAHHGAQNFAFLEPLMKEQVLAGNFPPMYFAILIDKYNYLTFKTQVYGTYWEFEQTTNARIVREIANVAQVDERRASIFLPPLYKSRSKQMILPDDYTR